MVDMTKGAVAPPQSPAQSADEPGRKERILVAAADLVSKSGYHAVSMGEIGAAAGITGPGIYRHFESKSAVLVALFDRAIDGLLRVAEGIALRDADPESALRRLITSQVRFVLVDRSVAQVYYTENQSLPEVDQRRLRRKQRLYLEEWVHPLLELRPRLDETEARVVVHAAIGAIQSSLFHAQVPAGERLDHLLTQAAAAVLGLPRAALDG
jgi:AcrR family transcriptional regulator